MLFQNNDPFLTTEHHKRKSGNIRSKAAKGKKVICIINVIDRY
jgi:hypothetical protein